MSFSKPKRGADRFGQPSKMKNESEGRPVSASDLLFAQGEDLIKNPARSEEQPKKAETPAMNVTMERAEPINSAREEGKKDQEQQAAPKANEGANAQQEHFSQGRSDQGRGSSVAAQKKAWVDIILDGTYSFTTIYPRVYSFLSTLARTAEQKKSVIDIQYGLTVFHADDIMTYCFERKKFVQFKSDEPQQFTTSAAALEKALREIEFYGGDPSGYEPYIPQALECSLKKLNERADRQEKCVLMFTDSLPSEDEDKLSPYMEDVGTVSGSHIYSYEGSFNPVLAIRKNGLNIQNNLNFMTTRDIRDLAGDENDFVKLKGEAVKLADLLIQQME